MEGFIFMGTDFLESNKKYAFLGFKICGHSIFLHDSYRNLLIRWCWNSWIGPSSKTRKIGSP